VLGQQFFKLATVGSLFGSGDDDLGSAYQRRRNSRIEISNEVVVTARSVSEAASQGFGHGQEEIDQRAARDHDALAFQ